MSLISLLVLLCLGRQAKSTEEQIIASGKLSWNTVLSIPEASLFYDIWISELQPHILQARKWHTDDDDTIRLSGAYNTSIAEAYRNATVTDVSVDYVYSHSGDLAVLLVISSMVSTVHETFDLLELYKFNELFELQNETVIGAYYRNDTRPRNYGRVNIVSDHNNATLHVLWLAIPGNIMPEYISFDPCFNVTTSLCEMNYYHLYATTYDIYTMQPIDKKWSLLSSTAINDSEPMSIDSVSLYDTTNQAETSVTCTSSSSTNSLQCYFQQNQMYEMVSILNGDLDPTNFQLAWIDARNDERGLFLIYPHENALFADIRSFNTSNAEILPTHTNAAIITNDSSAYSVVNPVDTSLVDSEYVLVAWNNLDVGVFLNAFDINGQPYLCADFSVYLTEQNITSLHVSSTFKYVLITFVTFDDGTNTIVHRIIDYESDLRPLTQCNHTISSNTHMDGRVSETTTAEPCVYAVSLSFSGLTNNASIYDTNGRDLQLLQAVTDALSMIEQPYSAQMDSISISNTSADEQMHYTYSVVVLFCIADEISYTNMINQLQRNQTGFIHRLEQLTELENIRVIEIRQDPNSIDDPNEETDIFGKYGVFGAIGIGLCVVICVLGLYFVRRRNKHTKSTSPSSKIMKAAKHTAVPSNTYTTHEDEEEEAADVEMAALANLEEHNTEKQRSDPLLRIDTLDLAVQKSLPPSRSINESLYDSQILTKNSSSFNYPDGDTVRDNAVITGVKAISKPKGNIVQRTIGNIPAGAISETDESSYADTQLHDTNSIISPKPIPRVKTFVADDTEADPYEHLVRKT